MNRSVESKSTVLFSAIVALIAIMIIAPLVIDALNSFKSVAGNL